MKRKNLDLQTVDIKMDADGRKFSGYASVFGGVDSYGDTIIPGAYKNTIVDRSRPIAMRWNHHGPVIGKWVSMVEDEKGLFVEGELTKGHSVAEDAYALLKHGAVTGMSIGYRAVKEEKNKTGGVDLHEIDLVEISVVESPADLGAQVADVKSFTAEATTLKEVERYLREEKSFSRGDAVALVSCIKSLVLGDQESKNNDAAIAGNIQRITNLLNTSKETSNV